MQQGINSLLIEIKLGEVFKSLRRWHTPNWSGIGTVQVYRNIDILILIGE